ncbi:TetR/AcrR family transcriptional regulator [Clostridium botulinum]|uniref:TetR/AcrR family transcriptional regulator n=1 Tax=Clostridium botulinum TaxID=1491 RepID=A0A6G4EFT6_CLOBO|nr:TetR/AcrR family transcriptional regulator [Clostridium botulinum]APH19438.1 bacterial regulatory s, tetR family protein [Clostridium botulinum]AUM92348.1 TetR family transcriptional regulator [Clostridium botulinum]NFB12429.1 TetR/AcrR family transcriptional regulator [Clostridium botulinum]NFH58372.1 TetR/AcrR family transcriptional regulator [Clostridium botulinum]NFH62069.1 TetR/AcrR family transcriptional regulator [Clostridium botulinum]
MSKSETTRQKILETTTWLIGQYGIEKSSLSMIANSVGIQKPSIYYYYSSKEELVDAVLAWILEGYSFEKYFQINEYTKENFVEKIISDGLQLLIEESTDTQILVVQVLNEFLLYGNRKSSHNKEYRLKIKAVQEGFINGFIRLMQKGTEFGLIDSKRLREKASVLALTLDNLSNYPMIGIQLDVTAVWRQAVTSLLSKGEFK